MKRFAENLRARINEPMYFPNKPLAIAEVNVELTQKQQELLEYLHAQDYRFIIVSPFEPNTSVEKMPATTTMLKRVRELAKEMKVDIYINSKTSKDGCEEKNLVRIPLLIDENTKTALVLELFEHVEKCW